MSHEARPPGRWFRHLLVLAGIWLAALPATPRHAVAQCSNSQLILSPCNGTVTVAANVSNQKYVFTFTNLLSVQQQVTAAVTCTGYVTSCTVSPGSVHLAANGSGADTVVYGTGNGISGTFKLSVSGLSSTITASAPTHVAPVVTLPYYNYDNVQTSLCAANCFDNVQTYTTPAYYTMDTPRSVTLMYRSNTANPMMTVQVDGLDNSSTRPTKMSLKIQRPGGSFVTFTNGSTELFFTYSTQINPNRLAGQFAPQGGDTLTGAYNYTAIVTSYFVDGTTLSGTTPLRILLENERSSVFGAGWTVAGQQSVHVQSDSSLVITDGTGSISWFKKPTSCSTPCTYVSPTGDYTTVTSPSAVWYQWGWDRRYPDGTIISFFASGMEVAVTDRHGNRAQTFYYGNYPGGQDSLIADPLGHFFHFTYTNGSDGWKAGTIRQIWDDFGRYSWFGINANNDEAGIEDPMGNQYGGTLDDFFPTYNAQHQMTSNVDRHGGAWHFGYDFAGKLAADTSPAVLADGVLQPPVTKYQSAESTFLINPSSGVGTLSSPAQFEGGGPWWANVFDPEGHETSFTLDRWGQPLTFNDAGGGTTLFNRGGLAYTMGGIPAIQIFYPWGAVDQFRYNASGLLTWSKPSGRDSTRYSYGNNFAIPDTITGPNQPTRISTVDVKGNVTAVTIAGLDTTHHYPDAHGRDTMIVDPLGHTTKYHYDATFLNLDSTLATGNRFTKLTFDQYGRRYTTTASGVPTQSVWYDALNRIVKTYGGAQNDTTRYSYDSLYLVRVQDANGQVFRSAVNLLGWQTQIFDPADTLNLFQSLSYDRNGNVIGYTTRRGQTVSMTYDGLGRVKSKSGPGILSATYSYSSDGRIIVGANAVSIDTIYADSNGWTSTIATTFPLTSGPQHFRINYSPTSTQQIGSVTVTSNGPIHFASRGYTWDPRTGLLSAIGAGDGNLNFYYDNEGLLIATMYNSQVMRYDDHVGNHRVYQSRYENLLQGGVDSVRDPAFHRNYYYDQVSRISQVTTPSSTFDQTFGYDSLGRFSTETDYLSAHCGSVDTTFGLNCASGGSSLSYQEQYDAVGNLRLSGADTLTYGTGDRILKAGSTTYTTDSEGDVIRRHDSTHDMRYGWSADGMLVSDTVASTNSVVQFDYNAFGRLVHRSKNGTSDRYYLWDGEDQLLAELDGTATHRIGEYVYNGVDNPVILITGDSTITNTRFPQVDELGNVVGVFGFAVSQAITYSPFGQQLITNTALADTNRLRWRGLMWQGDSTQLYYVRNRWYDPNTGRFIGQDPSGLVGGINPYAFAGGDYINGRDPIGLCADWAGMQVYAGQTYVNALNQTFVCSGDDLSAPWAALLQTQDITAPSLQTPDSPYDPVGGWDNAVSEMQDPGLSGPFHINVADLSRDVSQRTQSLEFATCTALNGTNEAFLFGAIPDKVMSSPMEVAVSLSAADAERNMLEKPVSRLTRLAPWVEKGFGALGVAGAYFKAGRECAEKVGR